jgi:hypothetical protein
MQLNSTGVWKPVVLTTAVVAALVAHPAVLAKDRFAAGIRVTEQLVFPSGDMDCQPNTAFPSAALGYINGTGLGTVIGSFTLQSVDCVRSTTPFFTPPYSFSSTTFRLIASNGDQIVASYSGTAELQPTGQLVLQGSFTFTGGTGAFSKVKGGGTLQGVQDISTNPATGFVALSGTISR